MKVSGKKFSVLGMARSGLAAARKIIDLGGIVFISDFNENAIIPEDLNCDFETGKHTDRVLDADAIIVSPGIPADIPILQKAVQAGVEVIGEIEFGFRIMNENAEIIAVTGSNGKSTTVSLIHHILQECGLRSILAGNIGSAFTSFDIEKDIADVYVLELSSFQIELLRSFKPNVSVLLNITPDHLNRYRDFDHYADTKALIFKNSSENDLVVFNNDDPVSFRYQNNIKAAVKFFSMNGQKDAWYKDKTIHVQGVNWKFREEEISINGPHNIQNVMASLLAVSKFNLDYNKVKSALKTFVSLAHRLEQVAEVNNVIFVNDSKATNTDSVKYALKTFSKPTRIILGGSDKGEDFSVLKEHMSNVAKIYLIGETTGKMLNCFQDMNIETFDSLVAAVRKAYKDSAQGDVILLSPACASYDMFDNYIHRGNSFREIAEKIKDEYEK